MIRVLIICCGLLQDDISSHRCDLNDDGKRFSFQSVRSKSNQRSYLNDLLENPRHQRMREAKI